MSDTLFDGIDKTNTLVLIISTISLLISTIVLVITYKTYILKYGQKVRGWVGEASSITSDNKYFHTLILENLKDKDLVVFEIYIRFGYNIYLDMLDKDDLNEHYFHIVPALSIKEFRFGAPIDYVDGGNIVNLSDLIFDNKIRKQIILSTNYGKIKVSKFKKGWNPITDYFRNYGTELIQPVRYYSSSSIYGKTGKREMQSAIDYTTYGNKTLYLVILKRKHFGIVTYPIWKDSKVIYFNKIDFSDEALSNKSSLKKFILHQRSIGKIEFERIEEIVDFQEYVRGIRKNYTLSQHPIKAENWFTYNVIDRLQTYKYKIQEFYKRKRKSKNLKL